MINVTRFQLWTALLVCLWALLFAAPNLLTEKAAKSLPSYVPHQQFNLGLDLQGGAYLLAEADMRPVLEDHVRDLRNQTRARLRGLAKELGLLVTGSSDYHGSRKTCVLGEFMTDPEVYGEITRRATGAFPVPGTGGRPLNEVATDRPIGTVLTR